MDEKERMSREIDADIQMGRIRLHGHLGVGTFVLGAAVHLADKFIGGDVLSATGDTFLILMITGAMIKVNADSAMARLKMEARIDRLEAALTENSTGEEA